MLGLTTFLLSALVLALGSPVRSVIRGVVRSHGVVVSGATVRVQATNATAVTNEAGEFVLERTEGTGVVRVTAWAAGHFIGSAEASPGTAPVAIELRPLPDDDEAYEWVSPFSASKHEMSCENCHSGGRPDSGLPFDEWNADAHARSGIGKRFLSVYRGTDLSGEHRSPQTKFEVVQDYGRVALRPDLSQPYYGPGYTLDFPGTGGNCAACHAPIAALRAPYSTVLGNGAEETQGITCDFCHKVGGVRLDASTGRPHPNTPGVLAFSFLRPAAGTQLFAGPFADVAPGDDTYSALHGQSRFCAPCHFSQFWGVQVYDSFGEWLNSPYARGSDVRTCQDCHMPARGATFFARLDKGGHQRDSKAISSHRMRGPDDVAFMESAARLELSAAAEVDGLHVDVSVTNSGAGHSLPTDHPGRNVLLVVSATIDGDELALEEGSSVPEWGGAEAGRPGKGFARILEDRWTHEAPTIAYWRPISVRSDNRIPALGTDSSVWRFRIPRAGAIRVIARLIYRRTFPAIARSKGWTDGDLVLQERELVLRQ